MLAHIILRWMLTVSYAIITFVLVCFRISGGAVLNTLINDIGDAWIEYRKHQGRNIVHIEKTRNELSNTIINIISLICVISIALSGLYKIIISTSCTTSTTIFLIIFLALSVYFTVVMQCLYMKMGKDCRPRFVVVHHVSNPNVYQAPIVHHMPKVVHHQQNPTLAINTKCWINGRIETVFVHVNYK